MTRTEQAELNELKLTPEQLADKQAHVATLLNEPERHAGTSPIVVQKGETLQQTLARKPEHGGPPMTMQEIVDAEKPARARRSDAGKPRKKEPEHAPGKLTRQQGTHLQAMIEEVESLAMVAQEAQRKYISRRATLTDIIDSYTAQ